MKKKQKNKNNKTKVVRTKYSIPQIPKVVGLKSSYDFKTTEFVSPLFGDDVKDESVLPFVVKVLGDKDKKYDAFRVERKFEGENEVKKYGKKYHEFTNFINKSVREENFGIRSYQEEKKPVEEVVKKPFTNEEFNPRKIEEKPFEPVYYNEEEPNYETKPNVPDFTNDSNGDLYEEEITEIKKPEYDVETHNVENDFVSDGIQVKIKTGFDSFKNNSNFNQEIKENDKGRYISPTTAMFKRDPRDKKNEPKWLLDQADIINETFRNHLIEGEVAASKKGPAVSRHEISLMPGVNVKRVSTIRDNIMMNLSANSLRIETPVPGKPYVGIEVPNEEVDTIYFGDLIDNPEFFDKKQPLKVVLGENIDGESIYANIADMPHALIAGATNSGKSVSLHVIIMSLLLKNSPEDLKLLLIDPKMVELSAYSDIPHLVTPVITDAKDATNALYWVVEEVESRYVKFKQTRSQNIVDFNINRLKNEYQLPKMNYIIVVIDELADLMDVADREVEGYIKRLSQKARAAGVHLIIATQRPTTEIISGAIKANITTRIAFRMPAAVDSVTILDSQGAEQLLGRGDMLYKSQDNTIRVQGAYISNEEIYNYTDFLRAENVPNYDLLENELKRFVSVKEDEEDELIKQVAYHVQTEGSASTNGIINEFNIGYNRATKIMNRLENLGIVSKASGTLPRKVLKTRSELEKMFYGKD